jgi:hypothetical protein
MTLFTYKFGGSTFINCSIPLAFQGHYYIVEPETPNPLVSVVYDYQGKPMFEVLKNEPVNNPLTVVAKTPIGYITVADKQTNCFLYKMRPGSETTIVFGLIKGQTLEAKITDRKIIVGSIIIENCLFDGVGAGVVVNQDGSTGIGAPIPKILRKWFQRM